MIKLKKLVFVLIICMLLVPKLFANSAYTSWNQIAVFDDWKVLSNEINHDFMLASEKIGVNGISFECHVNWYSTMLYEEKKTNDLSNRDTFQNALFQFEFDSVVSPVEFERKIGFFSNHNVWFINKVSYIKSLPNGDYSELLIKSNKLFQQMLNAKESLKVSAKDADGNKYSVSFSVKGLPEALMDFAERCGPEFQEFTGIKPN